MVDSRPGLLQSAACYIILQKTHIIVYRMLGLEGDMYFKLPTRTSKCWSEKLN